MAEKIDTRQKLLDAALETLRAGRGHLEMAEVTRRAGVSAGLAYHYFSSKAGLLTTLITEFYDRYDAIINQRFEGMRWAEGERRRLGAVIEFHYTDPAAPIVLGQLGGAAEVVAVEAGRRRDMIERGTIALRKAQERGDVDPDLNPEITVAVLAGGLRQAMAMALEREPRPDSELLFESLWRVCRGALNLPPDA